MREGLLWFDPDPNVTPEAKLAAAAARFAERFGRPANCCHVHPDEQVTSPTIAVVADPAVRRHHYWVGRDESLVPAPLPRRAARKHSA